MAMRIPTRTSTSTTPAAAAMRQREFARSEPGETTKGDDIDQSEAGHHHEAPQGGRREARQQAAGHKEDREYAGRRNQPDDLRAPAGPRGDRRARRGAAHRHGRREAGGKVGAAHREQLRVGVDRVSRRVRRMSGRSG